MFEHPTWSYIYIYIYLFPSQDKSRIKLMELLYISMTVLAKHKIWHWNIYNKTSKIKFMESICDVLILALTKF